MTPSGSPSTYDGDLRHRPLEVSDTTVDLVLDLNSKDDTGLP
jgi:hypothetical protein